MLKIPTRQTLFPDVWVSSLNLCGKNLILECSLIEILVIFGLIVLLENQVEINGLIAYPKSYFVIIETVRVAYHNI